MLCAGMCLLGGCGNEIAHKYSNFKSLCEDSGGSAVDASVCQCGTEKCSKGVICISGKCANTLCNTVGKTRCANDEAGKGWLSVCSGTLTWGKEEPCKMDGADISCRDDEKCGECKDGSFRCDTGQNGQNAKILVCSNGTWGTAHECGSEECGQDNYCVAQSECISGYEFCPNGGSEKLICDGGILKKEECEGGHNCTAENKCGECINSKKKCSPDNRVSSVCTNGVWGVAGACSDSETCNPETGNCEPNDSNSCSIVGETKCSDDANEVLKCSDGGWQSTPCNAGYCAELPTGGFGCVECKKICRDGEDGIGVLQCEGDTAAGSKCSNLSCNSDKTGCGMCKNGKKCTPDGKESLSCVQGNMTTETCPNGCNDETGECFAGGEQCKQGTTKCEDNKYYECKAKDDGNGNDWSEVNNCGTYGCNDTTKKCNQCKPGNRECKSNTLNTCDEKGVLDTTECPLGCDGSECKKCTDGQSYCLENNLYNCVNQKIDSKGICFAGCKEDKTGCNPCPEGNKAPKCIDNKIHVCDNGLAKNKERTIACIYNSNIIYECTADGETLEGPCYDSNECSEGGGTSRQCNIKCTFDNFNKVEFSLHHAYICIQSDKPYHKLKEIDGAAYCKRKKGAQEIYYRINLNDGCYNEITRNDIPDGYSSIPDDPLHECKLPSNINECPKS